MVKHTAGDDDRGRWFESPADTAEGHHVKVRTGPITPMTVDVPNAAALIGVSVQTIYRAVQRGQLARLKLGHRTLIRRSDLEAFLASLEVKGRG